MRTAIWGRVDGKNSLLDRLEAELQPDFKWPPEVSVRALEWGRQQEPKCRHLIDFMYNPPSHLNEPGLLFHREVPIIGATPDYIIYSDRHDFPNGPLETIVGEIKCPLLLKHHTKLSAGLRFHRQYLAQVQTHLLVTGAAECWFTSYHPKAAPGARLYREIVPPNKAIHDLMLERCSQMERMLQSGSRFPRRGTTKSMAGVPQMF
jgi:hypothetical protein